MLSLEPLYRDGAALILGTHFARQAAPRYAHSRHVQLSRGEPASFTDEISMSDTRDVRRAASREAYAVLSAEYRALPKATRNQLLADFRLQNATGGITDWARSISVALSLIQTRNAETLRPDMDEHDRCPGAY
jgi:hypothetical protein